MFMWTTDKFMHPKHATAVLSHFYNSTYFGFMPIRAIAAVVVPFLFGLFNTVTCGAVLLLRAVSTPATDHQYLYPFERVNLLFCGMANIGGLHDAVPDAPCGPRVQLPPRADLIRAPLDAFTTRGLGQQGHELLVLLAAKLVQSNLHVALSA